MCGGGGGYRPPPAVVQKPVQVAVEPAGKAKKKATKQVPKVGTVTQANLLGGTAGVIDDNLNLGGKSILGG